jgi:hypothetical protein
VTGSKPNAGAGICLEIQANVGQILNAYGNTLVTSAKPAASVDCAVAAAQVSKGTGAGACNGGNAVGVAGPSVNTNQIITLQCTQ